MNKYFLEFSKTFKKSLYKLDKGLQKQIEESVKKLESDYESCDIIKLSGIKNTYRLRIGDYRVLFKKLNDKFIILLLDVKHRKEVYRDL